MQKSQEFKSAYQFLVSLVCLYQIATRVSMKELPDNETVLVSIVPEEEFNPCEEDDDYVVVDRDAVLADYVLQFCLKLPYLNIEGQFVVPESDVLRARREASILLERAQSQVAHYAQISANSAIDGLQSVATSVVNKVQTHGPIVMNHVSNYASNTLHEAPILWESVGHSLNVNQQRFIDAIKEVVYRLPVDEYFLSPEQSYAQENALVLKDSRSPSEDYDFCDDVDHNTEIKLAPQPSVYFLGEGVRNFVWDVYRLFSVQEQNAPEVKNYEVEGVSYTPLEMVQKIDELDADETLNFVDFINKKPAELLLAETMYEYLQVQNRLKSQERVKELAPVPAPALVEVLELELESELELEPEPEPVEILAPELVEILVPEPVPEPEPEPEPEPKLVEILAPEPAKKVNKEKQKKQIIKPPNQFFLEQQNKVDKKNGEYKVFLSNIRKLLDELEENNNAKHVSDLINQLRKEQDNFENVLRRDFDEKQSISLSKLNDDFKGYIEHSHDIICEALDQYPEESEIEWLCRRLICFIIDLLNKLNARIDVRPFETSSKKMFETTLEEINQRFVEKNRMLELTGL